MDIQIRFHRDNLVIGSPVSCGLERLGVDIRDANNQINHADLVSANILEKESVRAAYGPDSIAGVHCLVANTYDVLPSKLEMFSKDSGVIFTDKIEELANAAMQIVCDCKPQHVLVELGPSGLDFSADSRDSCREVRDQYVDSGRLFEAIDKKGAYRFDAYMLSDIDDINELKCALMGLRQVSDKPVFVRCQVDGYGRINNSHTIYDYCDVVSEFGGSVAGITVKGDAALSAKLVKRMRAGCDLPLMIEYIVDKSQDSFNDTYQLKEAVAMCSSAGAQFFRVSGEAKPKHTAVLMAMAISL